MKKKLLTFLLFVPYWAFSQDFNTVYYNSKWEMTSMKYAVYYRNSGFDANSLSFDSIVTDHYMDGSVEMTGKYIKGAKDSTFTYFFPNQSVKMITNYTNNNRSGIWTSYSGNGMICKKVEYKDGKERMIEYNNKYGISLLKNGKGKFTQELYYDYYLHAFSETPVNKQNKKFLIKGRLSDGYKSGTWKILKIIPVDPRDNKRGFVSNTSTLPEFKLQFQNGSFIKGWYYPKTGNKTKIYLDTLTYLITEPEKISITESLFNEQGQLISQNYVTKSFRSAAKKPTEKFIVENESEISDFFNSHINYYAKNCKDTIWISIGLKFDEKGKISVSSIYPNIGTRFRNEIYRVVNLISKIRSYSNPYYYLKYRLHCLDELDYKK